MSIFKSKPVPVVPSGTISSSWGSTNGPSTSSTSALFQRKVELKCSRCGKLISEYWEYVYSREPNGYGSMSSYSTYSASTVYYGNENDEVEVICTECRQIEKLKE